MSRAGYVVREMAHGPAGYWTVAVTDFGTHADAAEVAGRFGHLAGEPLPDFAARLRALRKGKQVIIQAPKSTHMLGGGDIVITREVRP